MRTTAAIAGRSRHQAQHPCQTPACINPVLRQPSERCVSLSHCCWDKRPQAQWPETAQRNYLTVFKVRSPKVKTSAGLLSFRKPWGRSIFLSPPRFQRLPACSLPLGITLTPASVSDRPFRLWEGPLQLCWPGGLPHLWILDRITATESLLPSKAAESQTLAIKTEASLRGHYSVSHGGYGYPRST